MRNTHPKNKEKYPISLQWIAINTKTVCGFMREQGTEVRDK